MDTGSVGIIVGKDYFTPPEAGTADASYIGPGSETLTSSGYIFTGDWYEAIVNLYDTNNNIVAQSTVPVMAVTNVSCEPDARACTKPGTGHDTHYFGIGFGGGAGQPQGTPDKNAFLNVTNITGSGLLPSPGYILSTQGVQIGLTSMQYSRVCLDQTGAAVGAGFHPMANCPCICKCADRLATCAGNDHGEWTIGKRRYIVRYWRDDSFFNATHRGNAADRNGA